VTLQEQLTAFCRAQLDDPEAVVLDVQATPGHAGFSTFFGVVSRGERRDYVLRVPPPSVKMEGTADVLRQARVIRALQSTGVPVVEVTWAGDDPQWFGRPYFIVPRLRGDTLRLGDGEWAAELPAERLRPMAQQAMRALARLHRLEWRQYVPADGPPLDLMVDVQRWDRFWERAAEPGLVALGPAVKRRLLDRLPANPRIGIFHGDYQWTNLFYTGETLAAIIDWELWGVGATLNDLGWILLFTDREAWAHEGRTRAPMPHPAELADMYAEALGEAPGDVAWYHALAAYKFSIIGGFNLMLHRRGKRDDPYWEVLRPSIPRLMERALELLDQARGLPGGM
jgi:aminoglycoside phosphotransferase (APT) family kinase protein